MYGWRNLTFWKKSFVWIKRVDLHCLKFKADPWWTQAEVVRFVHRYPLSHGCNTLFLSFAIHPCNNCAISINISWISFSLISHTVIASFVGTTLSWALRWSTAQSLSAPELAVSWYTAWCSDDDRQSQASAVYDDWDIASKHEASTAGDGHMLVLDFVCSRLPLLATVWGARG